MKLKTLLLGAVAGLLLTACGGGSSPEDLTRSFVEALAAGDCDKALEMSVETAKETVQGSIDTGCEGYETSISSVSCESSDDAATCTCVEDREGMEMTYKYEVVKVDGAWKVSSYEKDLNMDGMDMGLGE